VVPFVRSRPVAEALPFADRSFDAVMAVLSDHHWRDRRQGLRSCGAWRVNDVVLFNADPAESRAVLAHGRVPAGVA
jgi:hypothetical protein